MNVETVPSFPLAFDLAPQDLKDSTQARLGIKRTLRRCVVDPTITERADLLAKAFAPRNHSLFGGNSPMPRRIMKESIEATAVLFPGVPAKRIETAAIEHPNRTPRVGAYERALSPNYKAPTATLAPPPAPAVNVRVAPKQTVFVIVPPPAKSLCLDIPERELNVIANVEISQLAKPHKVNTKDRIFKFVEKANAPVSMATIALAISDVILSGLTSRVSEMCKLGLLQNVGKQMNEAGKLVSYYTIGEGI